MPSAVICGDGCLNVVLELKGELIRGANIDIARTVRRPGGNALVTSLVMARLGVQVAYVGAVGQDREGKVIEEWMAAAKVSPSSVIFEGRTRISYAIVDRDERTIIDEPHAVFPVPDPDRQEVLRSLLSVAEIVMVDRYCQPIHALVMNGVGKRKQSGQRMLFAYRTGVRPSPGLSVENAVLGAADVCLTKRAFLENIGLSGEPALCCEQVSRRFGVPVVVATLGATGAAYFDSATGESAVVPALPIGRPRTTLGGGDFFRGGFLYAMSKGLPLAEAVRWGNATAGLHCRRPEADGADDVLLEVGDVEALLRDSLDVDV